MRLQLNYQVVFDANESNHAMVRKVDKVLKQQQPRKSGDIIYKR